MANITRFEDIDAWEQGRLLNQEIYALTKTEYFRKDYALRDQVRRAAMSITANIAEGFERNSNNEFLYFLSISKGSTGELKSLLYLALDEGYLDEQHFGKLCERIDVVSRLIGGLMRYLRSSEIRGVRYKK